MRKITLLFASLFLMMGSAWAQVTKLEDFKQDKCYTFTTTRGAWAVNQEGTKFGSATDYGVSNDATDTNQQFTVVHVTGSTYYLYSIGAEKFVKHDGSLDADCGEALAIATSSDEKYKDRAKFSFKDFSNSNININNEGNMKIDWWSDIDDGNAVLVVEAGDLDDQLQALIKEKTEKLEVDLLINSASAAVEAANDARVGAYTIDAVANLETAIDAYKETQNTENLNAVKVAYDELLANGEKVSLTAGEIFTVKCLDTNRGYMAYSTVEGKGSEEQVYLAGTNRAEFHPAADAEGAYTEWAIAIRDGKSCIYNVENKKYITSGTPVKFSETPCAVEFIALEGALWEVKFENAGFLSFSPGWGADCVRTEGGVDDGCKFYLEKTGFEVSPAEIIFPEWGEDWVELTEFGQTIQFAVDFTPIDAAQAVTWSTSNEEVLSINEDGLAEVVGYTPQGFEMINVIATLADGTKISFEVAVMVAPEVEEGGVEFVMLNTTYKELNAVGETFQLTATAANGNGEPVESEIVWSSSAYEVFVSETGLVQVLMPYNGTVTITATASNGVTATCMLVVSAGAGATLNDIFLNRYVYPNEDKDDASFKVGDTFQFVVTFDPVDFEDKRLSWTSDNEEVATVDENGVVTAIGAGEATITVTALADTWVEKSCTVTVVAKTTGIDAVEADAKAIIYDLTGRRVEKMEKGIYIVNGKKVLVK